MKAMLIYEYGDPDVFRYGEIETPIIGSNEVLIRVRGSSVNPVDTGIRRGLLKSFVRLKLPAVLGVDISGEVVQTGSEVTKFKEGERIYAYTGLGRQGGYGEYASIPEDFAARVPSNLSLVEAGVVPGVGLTAYEGLLIRTLVKPGMKVLIIGAGGGVGTFAIQIAHALGAEVTAVNSEGKTKLVKDLGVDHVIDYNKQDLNRVRERFDIIFNCVRGTSIKIMGRLLNPGGRLLLITGGIANLPRIIIENLFTSKKIIQFVVKTSGKNLDGLSSMISDQKVKPVIDKTYSWKDLSAAHEYVEKGHVAGKVAIEID